MKLLFSQRSEIFTILVFKENEDRRRFKDSFFKMTKLNIFGEGGMERRDRKEERETL